MTKTKPLQSLICPLQPAPLADAGGIRIGSYCLPKGRRQWNQQSRGLGAPSTFQFFSSMKFFILLLCGTPCLCLASCMHFVNDLVLASRRRCWRWCRFYSCRFSLVYILSINSLVHILCRYAYNRDFCIDLLTEGTLTCSTLCGICSLLKKKYMACGVHTALFQIERGEGAYGVDCIM